MSKKIDWQDPVLKLLSEILDEQAIVLPTRDLYNKPILLLEEPNEPDSSVRIRKLPTEVLAIKADHFPAPRGFFAGNRGENKRADLVILGVSGNKKWIVFAELKAGAKERSHILNQLRGAICVMRYVEAVAHEFHGHKDPVLRDFKRRFVAFTKTRPVSVNKRTTRPERFKLNTAKNDSPDNYLSLTATTDCSYADLVSDSSF